MGEGGRTGGKGLRALGRAGEGGEGDEGGGGVEAGGRGKSEEMCVSTCQGDGRRQHGLSEKMKVCSISVQKKRVYPHN